MHLTQRQVSQEIGRLVLKGAFYTLIVAFAAVVQGFRVGWSQGYLWLGVGALASTAGLVSYSLTAAAGSGAKGWSWMLLAFSGLVPYLFGCYLVFVRGLWALIGDLSAYGVARSIGFMVVGSGIVRSTYLLSEFIEALRKGKITVE